MDDNTRLAYERTYLGHERTQMAWIRLSLALITFGLAIAQFFEYLREKHGEHATLMSPRSVGVLMIACGVVFLSIATVQHQRTQKALRAQCPGLPSSLSGVAGAFIALLGLLALIIAFIRRAEPFP